MGWRHLGCHSWWLVGDVMWDLGAVNVMALFLQVLSFGGAQWLMGWLE